jgi:hypothetical protein
MASMVAAVFVGLCAASPLPLSFKSPMNENVQKFGPEGWKLGPNSQLAGADGIRLLNPTIKGAAPQGVVKFAKSNLWYERSFGLNEASMKVQVEVEGNLDKTDNSSFAFWVTHEQPKFVSGNVMGFHDDFKGFGVLFSKFKGSEAIPDHSELSIVVNREKGQMEIPEGCKVGFSLSFFLVFQIVTPIPFPDQSHFH